jgi:precorrin-2 dehydrogenase/sirohydrochlorin ferrochelatase
MGYYPIAIDLTGKKCLVVGGGKVALRKVHSLIEAGARVTVIATEVVPDLRQTRGVELLLRSYQRGDAQGFALVFAATDNPDVNALVAEDAAANGALVNVVDDPEKCAFIVPALVRRGDLLIAITTCGRCPALSRRIREQIEELYGPEYALFVGILGEIRDNLKSELKSQKAHERILLRVITDANIIDLLRQGHVSEAREKAFSYLKQVEDNS